MARMRSGLARPHQPASHHGTGSIQTRRPVARTAAGGVPLAPAEGVTPPLCWKLSDHSPAGPADVRRAPAVPTATRILHRRTWSSLLEHLQRARDSFCSENSGSHHCPPCPPHSRVPGLAPKYHVTPTGQLKIALTVHYAWGTQSKFPLAFFFLLLLLAYIVVSSATTFSCKGCCGFSAAFRSHGTSYIDPDKHGDAGQSCLT